MQAVLLANAASMNQELIDMAGKALDAYPDSTDLLFFKGIGYYETDQYESLLNSFKGVDFRTFSSEEYASQAQMLVAEAYYRLGDYAASDSAFERLIRSEPDNYLVLNNYSYYLAERGEKLDQARQWSLEVILNNPDNATFLDTHAWVLYKLEDYEAAEKYILDALNKGGENDPEVNEHAGDIQVALSSYEVARSYYRKAIMLGGAKERLEKKMEDLGNDPDQ
jgi:Tfp pilus assembly protein PilF